MQITAETILNKYDVKISTLGFQVRGFLLAELKDCIEIPDAPANIIAYGYGPGYKDMVCIIIPSKKGIKLGFNRGSELPDPEKLLTGSGKVHKYVEIKSDTDLRSRALKQLTKEAIKAWRKRTKSTKKE